MHFPDELLRRAESLADGTGDWTPPDTRNAATVVLLRSIEGLLEVFLMRRATTMAFAAGMHVFPAGVVDPDDVSVPVVGQAWDEAAHRLTASEDLARALWSAAARETFEECGVLLVSPQVSEVGERWERQRRALIDGSASFSTMVREAQLAVKADDLQPWSHWITPEVESRRYDTRFFVAALPNGQHAHSMTDETDQTHWMAPALALERYEAGELPMLLPTVDVLRSLVPFSTPHDVLKAARKREICPLLPTAERAGDRSLVWEVRDARTGEARRDLVVRPGERGRPG